MSKFTSTEMDALLGKRVKLRRKELRVSVARLAEALDLSQQQLSRYERGGNRISAALLVDIAALLDTPVEWFFLECTSGYEALITASAPLVYRPTEGLKRRLEQQWAGLTPEKQQALIQFLDFY